MNAEADARQREVAAMFDRHGPGYRWWAVLTVMLGTVSAIMEATVVNVALPEIIRVFHLGHDQVQLLSTGFLAATTASMLLATWAMQRFGVRRTYTGALVLLVTFSVLAALADRFVVLALCRIGQGGIAGLIQPLSMLVIIDVFPPQERGRAMGAYGLGIVLAPAVGPVAGGLLVDHFGWPSVFPRHGAVVPRGDRAGAALRDRGAASGGRAQAAHRLDRTGAGDRRAVRAAWRPDSADPPAGGGFCGGWASAWRWRRASCCGNATRSIRFWISASSAKRALPPPCWWRWPMALAFMVLPTWRRCSPRSASAFPVTKRA
jgi:nitrate/nitrite transporter NarK